MIVEENGGIGSRFGLHMVVAGVMEMTLYSSEKHTLAVSAYEKFGWQYTA